MWRPDAGVCVPRVADWGEHPEDLVYEKVLRSMPKRVLKKREIVCKDRDLEKVKPKMGKLKFSVACWHLSEYSKSSGPGAEAASIIHVFYEGKEERKVLNAFMSAGIDLESVESEPVDPATSVEHEQYVMYSPSCVFLVDTDVHEEGPPAELPQIKAKLQGVMG